MYWCMAADQVRPHCRRREAVRGSIQPIAVETIDVQLDAIQASVRFAERWILRLKANSQGRYNWLHDLYC